LQAYQVIKFRDALGDMPIVLDDFTSYLAFQGIIDIAREYNLTAYDAAYLELALRRNLPIATLDNPLAKAAKKLEIPVYS